MLTQRVNVRKLLKRMGMKKEQAIAGASFIVGIYRGRKIVFPGVISDI